MRRSRGIALVTVLLIVAIATVAATALLGSSRIAIHRTAALRDTEQAWWLAWSGQSFALTVLAEDLKPKPGAGAAAIDGLHEPWAVPVQFPVDQGGIRGQIVDQQGLFNLNTLGSSQAAVQAAAARQFLWLTLDVLKIPNGRELLAAVRDWMDADDLPSGAGGAEDSAYLQLDPPYRAGNRLFAAASELRAVNGMTAEAYRALRPFVTALPRDTTINVNTAPLEVLLALCANPDLKNTEAFVQARSQDGAGPGSGPASDVNDFIGRNSCDGTIDRGRIGVSSSYFRVQGEAFIGSSRVALYSLIHRIDPKTLTVLSFSTDGD